MSTAAPATPAADPGTIPAATPSSPPAGGLLTPGASAPSATPPADLPSTFFGQHIAGPDGKFQEGWTESLRKAGFERLATKAAFAPDEPTLFRTLDEAIGMLGKKSAPAYPSADANDADIAAFRKSAGIPDTPEAYSLKPENLPEGITLDDAATKDLADLFHQHHIPEKTAQALVAKHLEALTTTTAQHTAQIQQRLATLSTESDATFRKEWGEHYDARLQANRDFVSSRLTPEDIADPALATALSHPQIVRIIDEARRALRESPLPGVSEASSMGSLSPQQQAFEIMKANPNWQQDPQLHKRVTDLYKLEAAQARSKSRSR
jgi:hypothetical protein